MRDLSILIPARNEEFLELTIQDLLRNIRGNTDIFVALDGYIPNPQIITNDERVHFVHFPESIGQRASTNILAKMTDAKYLMKVDAHCAFDEGFDVKMMADMQDDWTMIPVMRNLHAFDWVCPDGHRRYQGPSGPCEICGKETKKDIVWIAKTNPQSVAYRFDNTLHFQYFNEYKKTPEYQKSLKETGLTETMSIQGSCFMCTRKKYFELNLCDEGHGSWGQQGTEVACKTWLSGGRVVVNHKTWYAHMFRTQGGDFGFPYPNPGIQQARDYSKDLWLNGKWEKAKYSLQWLINKFNPPGWGLSVGILYYTDFNADPKIMKMCQDQIKIGADGNRIVSVSLNKKLDFGDNIVMNLERGNLTMFKQILTGLKALDTDIIFFCEHDVLYHPSHFQFIPPEKDIFYYNTNSWRVRLSDGHALYYKHKSTSGLCAYRELLIKEYEERVRRVEDEGYHRNGYEPGTRKIKHRGFSDSNACGWKSEFPNLDIRHEKNMTRSVWDKSQFRDQRSCQDWKEDKIQNLKGWDHLMKDLLQCGQ